MKRWITIVGVSALVLLVVVSTGVAVYYYRQYRIVVGDASKAEELQTRQILAKIATVMDLPAEKPNIVTIQDRDRLQNQEFFKKAQNGDKIIIYEVAKRILLYRPSTGRVVDVAPLVFNNQGAVSGIETVAAPQQPVESLLPQPTAMPTLYISPSASPSAAPEL